MTTMTEGMQTSMAEASRRLSEVEAELTEAHGGPVAELPSMTVWADSTGHELKEIAEWMRDQQIATDVTRGDVSEWMHEQVRGIDHSWSASDPVVMLHD